MKSARWRWVGGRRGVGARGRDGLGNGLDSSKVQPGPTVTERQIAADLDGTAGENRKSGGSRWPESAKEEIARPSGLSSVDSLWQPLAQEPAEGCEVFHRAEGDELAREVADGGAFQREAHDGQAGFVGGGLAEEPIL